MTPTNLDGYRQKAKAFIEIKKEGLFDSRLAQKMAEIYIPDLCDEVERLRNIITDLSTNKIVKGKDSIKAASSKYQVLEFEKFTGKNKKKFL